jgi:ABC-type glutathione transport system ATPase component
MKSEEEAKAHFLHHHNHDNQTNHSSSNNQNQRPIELVFQNISVSVESKSPNSKITQERRILRDISGYARPGQILGVMGPSGSGKTTLLSTLSGRLKPTCGCITLNGEAINKQLRRKICYVLQQDIFFPSLSLRQTLNVSYFSVTFIKYFKYLITLEKYAQKCPSFPVLPKECLFFFPENHFNFYTYNFNKLLLQSNYATNND